MGEKERERNGGGGRRGEKRYYNVDLIALMRAVLHYTAGVGFPRVLSRREARSDPTSRHLGVNPGVNQISQAP